MIDFGKIRINDEDDYEQLFDYIDDTHIDKNVVRLLKKYIGKKV